jgi:site-specific DNA recombinase
MTKKCVIYARVSTEDQKEDGYGLEVQLAECRKYAASIGYDVLEEFAEDASGMTMIYQRPKGGQVCRLVAAGGVQAVIIHRPDRLSRRAGNAITTVEEWIEYGAELHLAQKREQVKSANDIGLLIEFWKATDYWGELREKSMAGHAAKVAAGNMPGRGRPVFGYRQVGQKKDIQFEIVEDEAEVIRRIFELYVIDGLGVQAIADQLTAERVPSCADRLQWRAKKDSVKALGDEWTPKKTRGAAEWAPGMIYPILKSETYTGVWYANRYRMVKAEEKRGQRGKATQRTRRPREDWHALPVPAIVTRPMWESAQRRLKSGRLAARGGQPVHEFLLVGRLTCECGYHLQGHPSWAKGKPYLYYHCNGRSRAISAGECTLPGLRASVWDRIVWDWIESILLNPEKTTRGLRLEQAAREKANKPLRDELARLDAKLQALNEREARLLDLYLDGKRDKSKLDVEQAMIDRTRKTLTEERAEVAEGLEEVILSDERVQTIEEFSAEMREGAEWVTFADKRQMLGWLEFKGRVKVEDGEPVIYAKCLIGRKKLHAVAVTD